MALVPGRVYKLRRHGACPWVESYNLDRHEITYKRTWAERLNTYSGRTEVTLLVYDKLENRDWWIFRCCIIEEPQTPFEASLRSYIDQELGT